MNENPKQIKQKESFPELYKLELNWSELYVLTKLVETELIKYDAFKDKGLGYEVCNNLQRRLQHERTRNNTVKEEKKHCSKCGSTLWSGSWFEARLSAFVSGWACPKCEPQTLTEHSEPIHTETGS